MLAPGVRVGVAVSGGADSVCLLHILRELNSYALHVVHINHKLRAEESDADERFVRELAASLELPFHSKAIAVAEAQDNLEQAGRNIRLEFFRELMRTDVVDRIATGHTRSDQAETVLYRFLRGSGITGLRGIVPVLAEGIVRPLISCDRAEVEAWLRNRAISWREDRTNTDVRFARNRIRRELLPLLARDYNPSLTRILAGVARAAQDEEQFWAAEIKRRSATIFLHKCGAILVEVKPLLADGDGVARRLLRRAIQEIKGDLRRIDMEHIDAILNLAHSLGGTGRIILPGLDIFRSFEWLRIAPPKEGTRKDRDYSIPLVIAANTAAVPLPGAGTSICLDVFEIPESGYTGIDSVLDADRLSAPLELRNWRPGDEYACAGHSSQRIKFLFQQARIPLWDRQGWPVITSKGRVVWVRQFGSAAEFLPNTATRRILRVREVENIPQP